MARVKRKVAVPNDWSGISIKMYQDFEEIKKKNLEENDFNLEVLSAICGIEKETAGQLEVSSLKKIFKALSFMNDDIPDTKELIKKVEWNGRKYGIIPNLSEITMGEYIDIEEYCKDAGKNLHKIMSILYRPIVKETKTRYSIESYSPNEEKSLAGKWGWYNLIFGLCNDNILNIKKITELELYLVLTYLCYQQDKTNIHKNNYGNTTKHNR